MALATLPPIVEIRELTPVQKSSIETKSYWYIYSASDAPWKTTALTRISNLEQGKSAMGFGNLRPSEQAAAQLRRCVVDIGLESLPLPTVVPLSGSGIMLSWQSGRRKVEATAFADGEIVLEALEDGDNPRIPTDRPEGLLKWLIGQTETL